LSIVLTLPYPPSLNAMYRTQIVHLCPTCLRCPKCGPKAPPANQRRAVPFKSGEYQDYERAIENALELAGGGAAWPRILKPTLVAVTANVYRPRALGDLDNTFKVLLDTLSGHAYDDDGQISELHAYRHDSPQRPRVELVISPLDAPQAQLDLGAPAAPRPRTGVPTPAVVKNRKPEGE
jgi:Holliday junction resolvase RusA-like endonuclease